MYLAKELVEVFFYIHLDAVIYWLSKAFIRLVPQIGAGGLGRE